MESWRNIPFLRRFAVDENSIYNEICIAACLYYAQSESKNGIKVYYADNAMYIEYLNFESANKDKIKLETRARYRL
jgi:hypothetical protein